MDRPRDTGGGTAAILSDILSGIGKLLQGELALARAEAARGLRGAAGGLAMLAAATVAGLVGLNVLAGAAVGVLVAAGLGQVWSPLIVGLGLCALAFGLALAGRAALRPGRILPRRSLHNLNRDVDTIKDTMTRKGMPHV